MAISASFGFGRNEKKPFGRTLSIFKACFLPIEDEDDSEMTESILTGLPTVITSINDNGEGGDS